MIRISRYSSEKRVVFLRIIGITLSVLILLFPVYWMLNTAISPSADILSSTPKIIPDIRDISFDSFAKVLRSGDVLVWLKNSAFVTLTTSVFVALFSATAGYGLSRGRGNVSAIAGVGLFGIRIIPTTLLVIPFYIMFSSMNLRNSLWSLTIANTVILLPFAAWIMKSVYDAIPAELEEAALVDGATRFAAFRRVVLPNATPGIGTIFIFTGILSWSEFAFARTLVQGNDKATVPVGTVGFVGEYTVDWGGLMATGLLSIIPMVILFILLEPLLVSGLVRGAVK